ALFFVLDGYRVGVCAARAQATAHLFPFRAVGVGYADNREVCDMKSQAVSPAEPGRSPSSLMILH
ncbi:MAG: hypothetical protein IJL38_02195, partial [Bacteroidales bacterium]|nr:hypothetical protein [Bacteroidales bacterium]